MLAAGLLVACFDPQPPIGLGCSEGGGCPPGQTCVDGTCRADDDAPAADASTTDAPSGGDGGAPGDAPPVDGGASGACAELRTLELPLVLGFSVISDPVVAGGPIKFGFESFGGEHIGIEITDREGAGGRVAEKVCTGGFTAHVAQAGHCGVVEPGSYCAFVTTRASAGGGLRYHAALELEVGDAPPRDCATVLDDAPVCQFTWPEDPCACIDE